MMPNIAKVRTLKYLNIGAPITINFHFVPYGKFMFLCVKTFKHMGTYMEDN